MNATELASELAKQLEIFQQLAVEVAQKQLEYSQIEPSRWDLRALANLLHDSYGGAERILERIARKLDKHVPSSSDSHQELLRQMSKAWVGVRPPVISLETYVQLDEFCAFRHVMRHAYAFELDWERMRPLVMKAPTVIKAVVVDINHFIVFLRNYDAD